MLHHEIPHCNSNAHVCGFSYLSLSLVSELWTIMLSQTTHHNLSYKSMLSSWLRHYYCGCLPCNDGHAVCCNLLDVLIFLCMKLISMGLECFCAFICWSTMSWLVWSSSQMVLMPAILVVNVDIVSCQQTPMPNDMLSADMPTSWENVGNVGQTHCLILPSGPC